jgi:hypothetical protein
MEERKAHYFDIVGRQFVVIGGCSCMKGADKSLAL